MRAIPGSSDRPGPGEGRRTILPVPGTVPHIGTLGEKPLHANLKRWYAEPGDRLEVPIDGYVVDVVRGQLLIEIQTRGFSSMKQKLATLLEDGHHVRIVHPIALDKWIVKVEADGTILSRRRSPRHGQAADVFSELVSFPELIVHPGLELEVLLTREDEFRSHVPGRAWRRKGWVVVERHLIEVVGSVLIGNVADLKGLLPDGMPEVFTTADIADLLDCPRRTAQQMAYCLRLAGAIVEIGKSGNAILYRTA